MEYAEPDGALAGAQLTCACGTFAIGRCAECSKVVCGSHSTLFEGRRLCQADIAHIVETRKMDARAAQRDRVSAAVDRFLAAPTLELERLGPLAEVVRRYPITETQGRELLQALSSLVPSDSQVWVHEFTVKPNPRANARLFPDREPVIARGSAFPVVSFEERLLTAHGEILEPLYRVEPTAWPSDAVREAQWETSVREPVVWCVGGPAMAPLM